MKKQTFLSTSLAAVAVLALSACSTSLTPKEPAVKYATLDGKAPLVVAHRGYSGKYPEQTAISYTAAADAGADILEMDVHMTRDCKLVARHNAWLDDNTNIADVAKQNPSVEQRRRTTPGILVNVPYDHKVHGGPAQMLTDLINPDDHKSVLKALVIDGVERKNDWSISDFTLNELQTLIKGTIYDNKKERTTEHNGKHGLVSAQQIIDIAVAKGKEQGRTIPVYIETKNPVWNNAQARANGCAGDHPFEHAIMDLLKANNFNHIDAPVYLQSFDPLSLRILRAIGMQAKGVQLIGGLTTNYETGEVGFITDKANMIAGGRPYSWTLSGNTQTYADMKTPEGLAHIAGYAQGVGPSKGNILLHKVVPYFKGAKAADVNTMQDSGFVKAAHKAGLVVHPYTFRSDATRIPAMYKGDAQAEMKAYLATGIDGFFTDFVEDGVKAVKSMK